MTYKYDELYKSTPNALGDPTSTFIDFFKNLHRSNLKVLDVGCGQGRDAIFIARLGHEVVAVDLSPHGIRDLISAAQNENLAITAKVADITVFVPECFYDIIIIDRTLHMLPKKEHLSVLTRLVNHVAQDGYVLIADENSNISDMKDVFATSLKNWHIDLEKGGYLFMKCVGHKP